MEYVSDVRPQHLLVDSKEKGPSCDGPFERFDGSGP